jgi:hypothetical protein
LADELTGWTGSLDVPLCWARVKRTASGNWTPLWTDLLCCLFG